MSRRRSRSVARGLWSASLSLAALAAAGLVAVGAPDAPAPEAVEVTPVAAEGQLVWQDEFNGSAGSAPDASKWTHETGAHGWGNAELQNYTTSRANSALDGNGNLVITARREGDGSYTSARMITKDKFERAYGRYEARIKLPRGQGIWPAFWMLGDNFPETQWPNSGEIDIMENIGREPHLVHGSLHGPGYSGGNGVTGSYMHPQGWSFADDFHTFAVDWTPDSITWYVDDVPYQTFTPADVRGNQWVYDHPFFMILNVAVGGQWPGYPDGSTQFPQQMLVDYVRVYDGGTGGTPGGTGRITAPNGICVDVAGANTASGTTIQLAHCNNNQAQNWTVAADGTLRAFGKCMDVESGSVEAGARVQLWDCNGTGAQKWVYSSADRSLRNPQSGKCLDAYNGNLTDGNKLIIWHCHGGQGQRWTLPA
ncbi:glycoside hydrolase family 16 protein [Actinorugispora endophytica]|uniref:Beta-glucanase (GH16 family) n=1 Tax=Actinorugispora endophytica TaxID=1605990 RepID=A0A4R6V1D0_9ACTN|nr:glycoside hydrolase family 16 protein [Actinorugispora endophytica]TDQ52192.1 beta-glucanase (GH16 family) [Actinorugispora endophytica]